MTDRTLDTLWSPRFKLLRAAGNIVLTEANGVLTLSTSPTLTVAATAPDNPSVNDVWIHSTTKALALWDGEAWV